MDYDLACRLIREAKDMWVRKVDFHCVGESTMHPRLIDILKLADEMGFDCHLSTNCYLLKGELADGMRDLRCLTLYLAVPWVMPAKFVDVCVSNALDYLSIKNSNELVYVQMVCDVGARKYYDRLISTFFHIIERQPNAKLYLKQPNTWPNDTPNHGFVIRDLSNHPKVRFDDIPTPRSIGYYCDMPDRFLMINADATVIPCCVGMDDWGVGSILNRSIRDVWHSDELETVRRKWKASDDSIPCGHCKKRTDCI